MQCDYFHVLHFTDTYAKCRCAGATSRQKSVGIRPTFLVSSSASKNSPGTTCSHHPQAQKRPKNSNGPGDVILSRAANSDAYQSLTAPCAAPELFWKMAEGRTASELPAISATIALAWQHVKLTLLNSQGCSRATTLCLRIRKIRRMEEVAVVDGLDDVVSKLDDIEAIIKNNKFDLGGWIGLAFMVWAVPWCWDAAWHSKWRYAFEYGVNTSQIEISKKPHDCEFLTAPVGEKHCDYEVDVSTLSWATSTTGQPIASYDEGKTWSTFSPDANVTVPKYPTVQKAYVSWEKKED